MVNPDNLGKLLDSLPDSNHTTIVGPFEHYAIVGQPALTVHESLHVEEIVEQLMIFFIQKHDIYREEDLKVTWIYWALLDRAPSFLLMVKKLKRNRIKTPKIIFYL